MSWMTEIADPAAARERALKSLTVPLGLANPLWLAFGAAASAGAAWWLMTRWAKPFNAEALVFAGAAPAKPAAVKSAKVAEKTPETTLVVLDVALDVAPAMVEAMAAPVETAIEVAGESLDTALEAASETVEAESVAVADALAEADMQDDLTRMVGVGPRTAAALAERGVTRFAHLAAWTEDELAAFDAELNLKGRSVRDAWLAQARRLAAEA